MRQYRSPDKRSRQDYDPLGRNGLNGRRAQTQKRAVPLRNQAATRRSPRPAIALDVLNGHLGYFVRRLQIWVFQDFIRTLARIDISPAQFSVVVVIGANRGLSQAELSATLGIERARLVRLLHRLEERGLVQRLPSSADGRRHALQLTPQGRTPLARGEDIGGAARTAADREARRRASSACCSTRCAPPSRRAMPSTAAAMRRRRRSSPWRAISMRPTGSAAGKRQEMAQRSKKLTDEVWRSSATLRAAKTFGSATSAMVGATIGVVGMTSTSKRGKPLIHGAHEALARPHQVDVIGRRKRLQPRSMRVRTIGSISAARRFTRSRCTA